MTRLGSGNGGGASGQDGGNAVEDLMRYDLLVEHALRQVVQFALARVAREGLPGEHHFYIAFDTRHEGVRMSERLRQKYPEEMTIVLQHQFWDLKVYPDRFEVGLSFSGIPEKLVVPFDAILGFYDPHVQFALQFRRHGPEEEELLTLSEQRSTGEGTETSPSLRTAGQDSQPEEAESASDKVQDEGGEEEKVVSLDAFRKKK